MSSLSEERDPESGVVSRQDVANQATETTSLLNASQSPVSSSSNSSTAVFKIVLVLIIGSFTASADGSLVLATHPTIASEFNALSASNWLFVSFNLAGAATQAVVGKLSDIYGRRNLIVTAYALFAAGCIIVGTGTSMGLVILGRVISGAGGSGLTILAMLIITDLVPLREAAAWQSYLNLAATTGRSLGGPLGGWLADTIGWRWSFNCQVPIFLVAIILTYFFLPNKKKEDKRPTSLDRIDFTGAALLALTIMAFLLPFEIGGSNVPWSHPIIPSLFVASLIFGGFFILFEGRWAKEPIFPLDLLRIRNVVLGYVISGTQCAAQLGLMFSVPLYFQVTKGASNTVAGAYLFPAVAGNAIGAILAGLVIKRTGRYKLVLLVATVTSSVSYILLLLRWHGQTNVWESLYIFPGGLGTGAVQTGVFVAVQAATDPTHKAAALGGVWLTVMVGAIVGMTAVSTATMHFMASSLSTTLQGRGFAKGVIEKVVNRATSDINYINKADPTLASAVVDAYVYGLSASHIISLTFSVVAMFSASLISENKV
ncbi:hypothetical protein FG05_07720 [Fusarium graminearum]|nr:hypothetical protein FG05_07720 [Fusarium graminearum]